MFRAWVVVLGLSLSGCSLITDADSVRREVVLARVQVTGVQEQVAAAAPDTVPVGADYLFRFRAFGSSCLEHGYDDVEVAGLRAVIHPYDVMRLQPGVVCDDVLLGHEHVVRLRFQQVGVAHIAVGGRGDQEMPVTLQRIVVVTPAGAGG